MTNILLALLFMIYVGDYMASAPDCCAIRQTLGGWDLWCCTTSKLLARYLLATLFAS